MQYSDKAYNVVKHLVQVVLPATGAAYFSLSEIYDWSNGVQVVGTITIVTTFLGVSLGVSSRAYNAADPGYGGALHIHKDAEDEPVRMKFELHPDNIDFESADKIVFEVVRDDDGFWSNAE